MWRVRWESRGSTGFRVRTVRAMRSILYEVLPQGIRTYSFENLSAGRGQSLVKAALRGFLNGSTGRGAEGATWEMQALEMASMLRAVLDATGQPPREGRRRLLLESLRKFFGCPI